VINVNNKKSALSITLNFLSASLKIRLFFSYIIFCLFYLYFVKLGGQA
jgi:hypothetical protein